MSATSRMPRRRLLGAALAGCVTLSLAACGSSDDPGSTELVMIAPDKALTAAAASYTSVPIGTGYFKEEGLKVTIQPVADAQTAVQGVSTGRAFMTYASLNAAFAAYQKDPGIAIIGMTNGNIFQVAVPDGSTAKKPADLKGRKIGVNTVAGASTMYAEGVLKRGGLNPKKDVEFIPVGLGAQAAAALKDNTVQAFAGWDAPITVLGDLLGAPMRVVPSPLNDLTGTSALIVSKKSLKEHPDQVVGMAKAFFKSLVFSKENPEAAVKMHWKVFPQSRPAGVSEEVALRQNVAVLTKRMEITGGKAPDGSYGRQTKKDIQQTVDTYVDLGMLTEPADVDSMGIIDYSLVGKYNDFDQKKVIEAARKSTGDDHAGK